MSILADYRILSYRALSLAVGMGKEVGNDRLDRPQTYSVALFLRSIRGFRAAVQLLRKGFVKEARTLVRGCFENLFWMTALAEEGEAFVEKMRQDDLLSRRTFAKSMATYAASDEELRDLQARMAAFSSSVKEKLNRVQPKEAATAGTIPDTHIFYQRLSWDSAHPTLMSLSCHVRTPGKGESGPTLFFTDPVAPESDVLDTYYQGCSALLMACVSLNNHVPHAANRPAIEELFDELQRIATEAHQPPA